MRHIITMFSDLSNPAACGGVLSKLWQTRAKVANGFFPCATLKEYSQFFTSIPAMFYTVIEENMTDINDAPVIFTKTLPEHGYCFVCGHENPHGIGIIWQAAFKRETPAAEGRFPPGSVQLFSDLQFSNYQQGTPMRVEAWIERMEGRKIHAKGHLLLPDGRVTVVGSGLYLHIPPIF